MFDELQNLRSRWTWVHGLRFHVRVPRGYQNAQAPAVVLVHGIGVSSRYMAPLATELAPYFRVYAPDLPGFGLSSKPPQSLGIEELADQLALWLDAEDIERPVLIGNSVGCQIVVELAARHPERVAAMVLQGPTVDAAARTFRRQVVRWLSAGPYAPPSLPLLLFRDYLDCGPRRAWETFGAALRHPIEERIAHTRAPTLVVRGSRDPIVSQRWCEDLAETSAQAKLVVIPGVAHTLNYAAAAPLRRVLLPFITQWAPLQAPLLESHPSS